MDPEAGDDLDWFGEPLAAAPREPVRCPRCGASFTERATFAAHLVDVHRVHIHRREAGPLVRAVRRWWDGLGFLPLWFVLLLDAAVVLVIVTALWPADPQLAAYAGGLATLPLVLLLSHRLGH